jgi:hypothetical protein
MGEIDKVTRSILFQKDLDVCNLKLSGRHLELVQGQIRNHRFSEYENWGIQHRPNLRFLEFSRLEDSCRQSCLDSYLLEHNWQYPAFSASEREILFDRLSSIRFDVLSDLVQKFICETFGKFRVSGLSIFGGVLYGHERQVPDDIDLIVLLEDADFTANPVAMYGSKMEKEIFCQNAPRPVRSGKVGLTIVGTRAITPSSQDETVKQFSLVYWGEAIPIQGDAFCDEPPPPVAHLPHPYRLMAWAYKDILMNQTSAAAIIRSLSRVIVGASVARTIAKKLNLDYEILMNRGDIWDCIYADPRPKRLIDLFIEFSKELAQDVVKLECLVIERCLEKLVSTCCGH